MSPVKGKAVAKEAQSLPKPSSISFLPRSAILPRDSKANESLLEKIDRLTAEFITDQREVDELPPLKLPKHSSSEPLPYLVLGETSQRLAKRPRHDNTIPVFRQDQDLRQYNENAAESSTTSSRPPQRRFLQALGQPSWLPNEGATGNPRSAQKSPPMLSEPSGATFTEPSDFEKLDGT